MVKPASAVARLEPYKITPQDVWVEGHPEQLLKLDWNEAPENFSLFQDELRRIVAEVGIIAWYPDYLAISLTDRIGEYVGLDPAYVLTFPGSDVGLETLCRTFLDPGDDVVVLYPTYENFFVYALQCGAELHRIELPKPFQVDPESLLRALEGFSRLKCIYLANPNNPCGYLMELSTLSAVADRFPDALVVVDEAYIEFAGAPSACTIVPRHPNLVVARTFSKAFGLAGMRLGYLCASPEVLNHVNKIRNGKNISMLAQKLGEYALTHRAKVDEWIAQVRAAREAFQSWLSQRGLTYYPSHGNFVMFEVRNPADVCSRLKARGVYVRNRHSQIPGAIRVTIGSAEHVQRLITELEALGDLR
jgi:histidinol-phosphate aminotransferase